MSMMLIKPFLNFWFGLVYCRVCIPLFCAYCFVVVMFHYNEHKKEQYMKNKQGKLQPAGTTKGALHNSTMSNGSTTSKDKELVTNIFLEHLWWMGTIPKNIKIEKNHSLIFEWQKCSYNEHN
jgi:hypothetical protein